MCLDDELVLEFDALARACSGPTFHQAFLTCSSDLSEASTRSGCALVWSNKTVPCCGIDAGDVLPVSRWNLVLAIAKHYTEQGYQDESGIQEATAKDSIDQTMKNAIYTNRGNLKTSLCGPVDLTVQ